MLKKNLVFVAILISNIHLLYTQTTFSNKGSFFVYWGYNRAAFSKSDIHFKGPDYDFIVKDAKAKDRPSPFEADVYFNPAKLSIPQFNVRAGFFIKEWLSLSVGYDHMKYVFNSRQTAIVDGTINRTASLKYMGNYDNVSMKIPTDFIFFEHTDGLNLVSVDGEINKNLFHLYRGNFNFELIAGAGVGLVIPRSDVLLFNHLGMNNRFHLAGYGVSYKFGFKPNFKNKLFLLMETRQGFINLPDVLIQNDLPDRANHSFMFYEFYITLGYKFKLFKVN